MPSFLTTMALLVLCPTLAFGQLKHWWEGKLEVFRWDDLDTAFHGPDLHFERVAPPEMSSQISEPIGRDRGGFLWLASRQDYLLRYDGLSFVEFKAPKLKNSTAHIIDNDTHTIWLSTEQGLCCFDMSDGQYQVFPNHTSRLDSTVKELYHDPHSQVLLARGGQEAPLFVFDLAKQCFVGKFKNQVQGHPASDTLTDFFGIVVGKDGSYWANVALKGSQRLAYWPKGAGAWTVYEQNFIIPHTGNLATEKDRAIFSIYPDPNGPQVWMGGYGGLLRYDLRTGQWQQFYLNDPSHHYTSNLIYDVIPWGERYLALPSHNGLKFFDKQTHRFYNHSFFSSTLGSNWSHIVHQPLLDQDGTLWLMAGVTGLYKLDPHKQFFSKPKHLPPNFSPNQVFVDTASQLAMLMGFNYDNNHLNVCRVNLRNKATELLHLSSRYSTITAAPSGNGAWIFPTQYGAGTIGTGIWRLSTTDGSFGPLSEPVLGLPPGTTTDSLGVCRFAWGKNGDLWIGSEEKGLIKFDKKKDAFLFVRTRGSGEKRLSVLQLLCDEKGMVWFVDGDEMAMKRLDPATLNLTSIPLPIDTMDGWYTLGDQMAQTADGKVWASVMGKLFWFDGQAPAPKYVEVPRFRPVLNHLQTDDEGNLWFNSEAGLVTYNCQLQKWKVLTSSEGLFESPADEPVSNCVQGQMYLTGAAVFRPSELRFNEAPAMPVFTGFQVKEQKRDEGRFLHHTRRINLRPGEDALTIEFAATNFTKPEDNQFAYRLVGETDWVDIGTRRSATFTNMKPGSYRFELKAANSDGLWHPKASALDIYLAPYFYQTWWFKSLAAALALAAIFVFYRNRMEAARREALLAQKDAELRQQQAEFQQQVAELENAALRSQMNPHFIFNVLNSIHYFLDANDARSASGYLAKFSRLVRLVLDHSSQKSVTLHNDLAALLLYLEMEALRFKGKLTYTMDVDHDIDQKYLRVPPLLIQPFVENAIWHGLMHKHGGGNVGIHIAQPDENLLRVVVEDNGIGRAAAMALKSKSATINKSRGMNLTARRLALLGGYNGKQVEINILDLTTPDGQASGTKVVLEIPV